MGRPRKVWTPVGPQGAGRIEPLRGEHARPPFFERAWWGEFVRTFFLLERFVPESFLERFVPELVFGTIYPRGCLYGIAYSVQRMTDGV